MWAPVSVVVADKLEPPSTFLALNISGTEVLREGELPLPGWDPAPYWRVAFAAATPPEATFAEAYSLHLLRLYSGLLPNRSSVPVRVSLNGQQFSPHLDADAPRLAYMAPPVVSSVMPPLGPLRGGSVLVVRGANLDEGSAPRVALGDLPPVVASHAGAGALRCLTPLEVPFSGAVDVRVSLNGAQYSREWREPPPLCVAWNLRHWSDDERKAHVASGCKAEHACLYCARRTPPVHAKHTHLECPQRRRDGASEWRADALEAAAREAAAWVTEVALALGNAPRLLRRWLTGSLLATAASALPLAASASRQ